jgi:general stress protein 26
MPHPQDLAEKLWKSLKSDRTLMLSLTGVEGGASQPMTALIESDAPGSPLWIFTAKDTDFAAEMGARHAAVAHFASKGHDIFATLDGELLADNDRAAIDRLWNPYVAAWFEGGKDDPNLQLLRFEPEHAHIWLNENNLFAGVKLLLGRDPKKEYADKSVDVRL